MKRFLCSVAVLALFFSSPAQAQQAVRYAGLVYGGIAVTGNAIGLAKQVNANGPGLQDSIGTFMAGGIPATQGDLQNSLNDGGWDLTGVPLSSADAQLAFGQSSFRVAMATTGDNYTPAFFAFQVDAEGPEREVSGGGGEEVRPDRGTGVGQGP